MDHAGQAQFIIERLVLGKPWSSGRYVISFYGFTGNFIGVAVHDLDKKSGSKAYFQEFTYRGKDLKTQANQEISKSEEMIITPYRNIKDLRTKEMIIYRFY